MGLGGRGRGGGGGMDVNEELKFLGKFTKKIGELGRGGGLGRGVGLGSQGGCERRIEAFGKIPHTKKIGGGGGGGGRFKWRGRVGGGLGWM